MTVSRWAFLALRVLGAAAGIAAIVGQLRTSLDFWDSAGVRDTSGPLTNFFSFFTIQSNIGAIAVLLIGAVVLALGRDDPRWFSVLRGCVTAYMTVTGIVYNMLLRGIELPQGATLEWSNEILHVALPAVALVDWLFAPGRRRLAWRDLLWVIAYPVAWAAYTMIRGPLVHDVVNDKDTWYPYPFLDPATSSEGYVSVAFYVVLIAGVIGGTGAAAVWWSRRLTGRGA